MLALGDATVAGQDLRHAEFIEGADLLIHDAQYTAEEYREKVGWGHSPAEYVDVSGCCEPHLNRSKGLFPRTKRQHETGLQFRLRRKHNIAGAARLSQKCNSQRTTPTFGGCRASWKGVRN